MRYISIDIETSGIDPLTDQVLEFGAVIEDTLRLDIPVERLPTFRRIIKHERITGTPFALRMNAGLIASIAKTQEENDKSPDFCTASTLSNQFAKFLVMNGFEKIRGRFEFVAAGKNFGSFDAIFLDNLPRWKHTHNPIARVLDPAILYFDPLKDEKPPSTSLCLERAGLDPTVKHTAVGDAQDVIRLLRRKFVS